MMITAINLVRMWNRVSKLANAEMHLSKSQSVLVHTTLNVPMTWRSPKSPTSTSVHPQAAQIVLVRQQCPLQRMIQGRLLRQKTSQLRKNAQTQSRQQKLTRISSRRTRLFRSSWSLYAQTHDKPKIVADRQKKPAQGANHRRRWPSKRNRRKRRSCWPSNWRRKRKRRSMWRDSRRLPLRLVCYRVAPKLLTARLSLQSSKSSRRGTPMSRHRIRPALINQKKLLLRNRPQ